MIPEQAAACQAVVVGADAVLRRRMALPTNPNPAIIIARLAGSRTMPSPDKVKGGGLESSSSTLPQPLHTGPVTLKPAE